MATWLKLRVQANEEKEIYTYGIPLRAGGSHSSLNKQLHFFLPVRPALPKPVTQSTGTVNWETRRFASDIRRTNFNANCFFMFHVCKPRFPYHPVSQLSSSSSSSQKTVRYFSLGWCTLVRDFQFVSSTCCL